MEIISCSPSTPEVLRVLQRFSISPSCCCLLAGRALSRKSTGKQARSFIDLPEQGCTGGIADGELGAALGQAPCALLGDRAAVHSPGGGWGLSPCPGHPLAVHCLTPGQPALTGGATLIRITAGSAECPRSSQPGCAHSPSRASQDTGTAPQEPGHGLH